MIFGQNGLTSLGKKINPKALVLVTFILSSVDSRDRWKSDGTLRFGGAVHAWAPVSDGTDQYCHIISQFAYINRTGIVVPAVVDT